MEKENYIEFLKSPEKLSELENNNLHTIIEKYPYFQSARALYLKNLKTQDSFKYNKELKKTAAYTTNRTILFEFITSKYFGKAKKVAEEKRSIKSFFSKKDAVQKAEEALEIHKPLNFAKNETFSFNQWLQIKTQTPIKRNAVIPKKEETVPTVQDTIIDKFISNNPKISRPNKTVSPKDFKIVEQEQSGQLMTETLAKVYLAQKKYDSAIQAYKILSLKYPEKSGFFADQIKKVQTLQNNK